MALKPILFNTDMVRAILHGRKTQTRRIIKPQPEAMLAFAIGGSKGIPGTWGYPDPKAWESWGEEFRQPENLADPYRRWTPPCHTDDVLWVRETWYYEGHLHFLTAGAPDLPSGRYSHRYIYKADDPAYPVDIGSGADGWKPSIHMPKEAARLFLKVTHVWVERLQDITQEEIRAEGCVDDCCMCSFNRLYNEHGIDCSKGIEKARECELFKQFHDSRSPETCFVALWDSTVKDADRHLYGWDANPYVWAIQFERIKKEDVEC